MIWLPLQFIDKVKSRNLEVNFLVVDVPTTYDVILGKPTLHRVKAVIAPTCYRSNMKQTMAL